MTPSNRKTLALSLLCAALSLGAWQSASAAAPKDTLMIGKAADPQTLDPAVTIDNNDWAVTYPAYQKLVAYKVENGKGSTEVKGDLADSWTTSADGLVWDFKLKPGNKFDVLPSAGGPRRPAGRGWPRTPGGSCRCQSGRRSAAKVPPRYPVRRRGRGVRRGRSRPPSR